MCQAVFVELDLAMKDFFLHTLILSFSFFCLGKKFPCEIRNQASSLLSNNLSKFGICAQPEMVGQTCRKKYDCSFFSYNLGG
jgi:hypothetical protein